MVSIRTDGSIAEDKQKVAITALAFSLGSLAITTEEKVKTIKRHDAPVDAKRETEHVLHRLGIESTSVPEMGETPVTNAALSVVKLALLYNLDLGEITEVDLATESAKELSKNLALDVMKLVNSASRELGKKGIHIGRFRELGNGDGHSAVHTNQLQNACASAWQALYGTAKDGLSKLSKKLIIASDHANYVFGTPADETNGFGAVAFLVENAENAKGRGLHISSRFLGEANISSKEFLKSLALEMGSGLGIINTDPIVSGTHSDYTYMFLNFEALNVAFKNAGLNIRSIGALGRYDALMHLPYATIPLSAVAYFIRHLAHDGDGLKASLLKQTGMAEPFTDGFTTLRSQFKFIHDLGEISIPLDVARENLKRLGDTDFEKPVRSALQDRCLAKVEGLLPQFSRCAGDELVRLTEKHPVEGEARSAILSAAEVLRLLSGKGSCTLADAEAAFKSTKALLSDFAKRDTEYNNRLRETEEFKYILKEIHIMESSRLTKKVGNIDTGSAGLGLISHVLEAGSGEKPIIVFGYGSGSSAVVVALQPKDIGYMRMALEINERHEFESRQYIGAEEYSHRRRAGLELVPADERLPIWGNSLSGYGVNSASLYALAQSLKGQEKVPEKSRM